MFVFFSLVYAVNCDGTLQLFVAFCLGLALFILTIGMNTRAFERAEIHFLACICQAILLLYVASAHMLVDKDKREAWSTIARTLLICLFLSGGVVVLGELRGLRAKKLALQAVSSQVGERGTLRGTLVTLRSILAMWRSQESITSCCESSEFATPHAISTLMRTLNAYAHHSLAAEPLKLWQIDLIRRVACEHEAVLDVTSPISQLSGHSKAQFWRSLAQNYPGVISFVAKELEYEERFVVFGVLCKLQRFLDASKPADRALDDVVDEPLRSSILYALLSAPRHDESLARLLRMILDAGATPQSCGCLWLPRSIVDAKTHISCHPFQTATRNQLMKASKNHVARHVSNFEFKEEAAVTHMETFIHIIRKFPVVAKATDADDVKGILDYCRQVSGSRHDSGVVVEDVTRQDSCVIVVDDDAFDADEERKDAASPTNQSSTDTFDDDAPSPASASV